MTAVIIGGLVALSVLAYAWWSSASIRGAERTTADARVALKETEGKLGVMTSDRDAHKARADYQEKRANALDQELDTVADSGDPAGARGRVLSRLTAAETAASANSGDTGAVSAGEVKPHAQVAAHDDTALEPPGT